MEQRELAIHVDHVTKVYKLYQHNKDRLIESLGLARKPRSTPHYALNDVSLDIYKGETVGIIGTNGSGKSTILKIITGVLHETSGTVEVNGRISALLELGAGFDMNYTGKENIFLYGATMGFSRKFMETKYDEILEFSELQEFIDVPMKNYSSGMRARLGFAVATVVDPEVLILDEVLSVGDARFRQKSEAKIMNMFDKGTTVVFVSHNTDQVRRICNRAILLQKGQIIAQGTTEEVCAIYDEMTKKK